MANFIDASPLSALKPCEHPIHSNLQRLFKTSDGADESLPPAFTVFPSVIARNVRTVIVHWLADFDFVLFSRTRLMIQKYVTLNFPFVSLYEI